MVNITSNRCKWCGARGHEEPYCHQKEQGRLPNVSKLRIAICNNILKKHVYKKYFRTWKKTAGIKERPTWVSAIKRDVSIKKYFWMWQVNAYEQKLEKYKGVRWADIDD